MKCSLKTENYNIRLTVYTLLLIIYAVSCSKDKTEEDVQPDNFILKELESGMNIRNGDRINLVVIGKGYTDYNELLNTVKRDLALNGNELYDANTIDKVLLGLFAIEPFKSNKSIFNVWIFPQQITISPLDFIQSQQNGLGEYGKNFTLNSVSYLVFLNPQDSPQSFAYPANVQPGVAPVKAAIVFGSATVTRYATISDGMSVVANELGHSLFNLRDEYVRTGVEFGDRYGHNIARNQTEAQSLWGDVVGQVDPFYYEWKAKMQSHNIWIDKSNPECYFDAKRNIQICSWYPDAEEIKVGFFDGGGITTTGISVRPTYTSLMSNEDVRDKSWPRFPPVFGMANRKVMQSVFNLYSGK
jgi:hypothetical protein